MDVLTFHEGENLEIANCRIHRIGQLPWIRNIRPGLSVRKVICDLFMFVKCLRMVGKTRYDLILRARLGSQAKAYGQQEFTPEAAQRKLSSFYTMMESKATGTRA